MKILAIMGSPHKGNTLEITQKVEDKLKNLGEVEFEYIHLKDMDLRPCLGCYVCFHRGEDRCPLKDDRDTIIRKMEEAEGLILVTPVYSMQVSYLLKLFIDRLAYTFHRPRYFGKYAIAIVAAGNPGLGVRETLKYLKLVANQWGFEYVDQIGMGAAPKNTSLPNLDRKKDRTDEVVKKFYRAIREKRLRKLTLGDHFWFRCVQAVYRAMGDRSPVDYQYFKENGWLNKNTKFFYNRVKTNPFLDGLAKMMSWFVGKSIEKSLAA